MPSPRPDTALALSGGGLRLTFHIGALRHLYDVQGIAPAVIAGTSAGAIVAATLAQHADPDDQRRALDALTHRIARSEDVTDYFAPGPLAQKFARIASELGTADLHSGEDVAMDPVQTMRSLAMLGMTGSDDAGPDDQALFRVGPGLETLTGPSVVDPEGVSSSGVLLRLALVCLETGELHYATEKRGIVDAQENLVAEDGTIDLAQAVLASAALPGYLPPRRLHGRTYVDGGLRAFLPRSPAVADTPVTRTFAVSTRPVGVEHEPSYARRGVLDVLARAHGDVASDEVLHHEVEHLMGQGLEIIAPTTPVHGVFEYDPVLAMLSIDDGWMAAAAHHSGRPEARDTVARLTRLRRRTLDRGRDGDSVDATELAEAVAATPADLLPPSADLWCAPPEEQAAVAFAY